MMGELAFADSPQAIERKGRLRLALHPVVPYRSGEGYESHVRYGYDLRVFGGPRLAARDPLLAAFAVYVTEIDDADVQCEDLQCDGFEPGSDVRLSIERMVDGTSAVGVWDLEQRNRAGHLSVDSGEFTLAALRHGLKPRCLVLDETRAMPDGRRASLTVMIFAERFVHLSADRSVHPIRPSIPRRRRIVLVVGKRFDVSWWDGDMAAGPASLDDLPLSPELRRGFHGVARQAKRLRKQRVERRRDLDHKAERALLHERLLELWLRTRYELRRDSIVGFLSPQMTAPAWAPVDLPHADSEQT